MTAKERLVEIIDSNHKYRDSSIYNEILADSILKEFVRRDEIQIKKKDVLSPLKILLQRLAQKDCGDNSCLFMGRKVGGMRTNGGCRCYEDTAYDIMKLFNVKI